MNNEKFKNLLKDTYKIAEKNKNILGLLYTAVATYNLKELVNFEQFVEKIMIDMIYIKSLSTNVEICVYEWELEDYKIDESKNIIYVKIKNKPEVAITY